MRILHVIDSGGLYGAEIAMLTLASEQRRQGHEPVIGLIMTPEEPVKAIEPAAMYRGLEVVRILIPPGISLKGFRLMPQTIARVAPDIVHAHGYKAIILLGYYATRGASLPCVATAHGYTATGRRTRVALFEALDRRALKRLDAVAAVSPVLRDLLVQSGVEAERLHVIRNGFEPESEQGPPPSSAEHAAIEFCARAPTVLGIGRLAPEKDFSLLLEAFALLDEVTEPPPQLLILGEGGLRDELAAQAGQLQLGERFSMPGYVPSRNVLPRAAALAITSKTEGLPMVLLEAMRAGVPVISTAVGGMPDALGDPPCGRLLETRQAEEIAGALAETLRGGESVAAMTARARARFEAQFTSATMADSYQRMYLAASRPEAGDHDAA